VEPPSTLPFGGNPDFFVGAVPGEFVQSVTTVCDGFSKLNLSFANNVATITGSVKVWGGSTGGFGSTTRAYTIDIVCSKFYQPGTPVTAPC